MRKQEKVYSIVGGTRIYWDEDYDARVAAVIESLASALECRVGYNPVIAASEHEGTITLIIDKLGEKAPPLLDEIPKIVSSLCEIIHGDHWATEIHILDTVPSRSHEDEFEPVKDTIKQYLESFPKR